MTIKKLYLDEFGNVITAEDGDSMSNGLLLNGVGLSAGREPNQNTEELVKRWNAYDANQQEIAELKQLAETKNARTLERIGRIERQEREISELKTALHLAVTKPMQPLINHRFKENKIVRHCLDAGGTDLNKICMIDFSVEDREQFAQLIGYSLGGYAELSYVTDKSYYRAEKQCEGKS